MAVALLDALADRDDRALVDAGALVAADELEQLVLVELAACPPRPGSRSAVTLVTTPARRAMTTWPESRAARASMPVPTIGALGLEERDRLALHVRAHQGAVGVVVLEERDQRRRDGHDLLGADVHVLDLVRAGLREGVPVAARHALGR